MVFIQNAGVLPDELRAALLDAFGTAGRFGFRRAGGWRGEGCPGMGVTEGIVIDRGLRAAGGERCGRVGGFRSGRRGGRGSRYKRRGCRLCRAGGVFRYRGADKVCGIDRLQDPEADGFGAAGGIPVLTEKDQSP
jgi:hypothetical protein